MVLGTESVPGGGGTPCPPEGEECRCVLRGQPGSGCWLAPAVWDSNPSFPTAGWVMWADPRKSPWDGKKDSG